MQYNEKLLQAILRRDFGSFIAKVFHTVNPGQEYYPNWHIELIADYLEAVRKGEIRRLIINMPPRALKSICVSVAWPAWLLGHKPDIRIMVASYSSILSIKHSLDCKLVILANWYKRLFSQTILSKTHNQKSKFLTTANGFRFATSVGGSSTGEGGDILIIDDPHNPTKINSLTMRNYVLDWFEQTFATRLNNPAAGAIVLVMQRLHEDDLTARLMLNDYWAVLKIPAIAKEDIKFTISNKEYHYLQGSLLNENRDPAPHRIEQEIGTHNYAAQFLQQPLPSNYNLLTLTDITYYEELPVKFDYYIQSWDTAIKLSLQADYSVCTCWGVIGKKFYLVALIRQKLTYPELKNTVEQQAKKYFPRYILIEDKASGQSIIQDLRLSGYNNIRPIKPRLDKVTRFAAVVPIFQSGIVVLPGKAPFNHLLISELTSFPNSKNDDIVDSVSQFLNFTKEIEQHSLARIRRV